MSSFHQQVAVVTGAGSGIGRELALGLARRGATLSISDVNNDGLAETATRLQHDGATVHQAVVDVADRDAVQGFADSVLAHHGRVNQVYNNAGIAFSRTVLDSEYADYERVIGVNLWGVIHGTKAFLPHLIASGAGHVINLSSLSGIMAQDEMSHYCTTKFAVRGFTETLRVEMLAAHHPVQVTVVHPGGVKTAIVDNAMKAARELGLPISDAEQRRRRVYNEKLLRMNPEDAAEIILNGVAANRPRVIVGNDARLLDFIVRVAPAHYPELGAYAARRMRAD